MGDTQWCTGEVTEKHLAGEHCVAELALRATSQRGEETTIGQATVILPSKDNGPVQLPVPSTELRRYGAELVTKGARLHRERAGL